MLKNSTWFWGLWTWLSMVVSSHHPGRLLAWKVLVTFISVGLRYRYVNELPWNAGKGFPGPTIIKTQQNPTFVGQPSKYESWGGANNSMTTVMHSTERKTHVLHPPAEPLNIKSEIFSDFVSLESSKDFNSLPAPTLLPSPPLSSRSSAGDELEFDASIAGLNINGPVFIHVLHCDRLPITFRLRNLGQESYLLLFSRPDIGLLHWWPRKLPWRTCWRSRSHSRRSRILSWTIFPRNPLRVPMHNFCPPSILPTQMAIICSQLDGQLFAFFLFT